MSVLRKGDRVPALTLPGMKGAPGMNLRGSRGPRVFVTLHDVLCARCLDYVAQIAAIGDRLAQWGGDVVVIGPRAADAEALPALPLPVFEDRSGAVAGGRLGVIIADEWGEVFFASDPARSHEAVSVTDVLDWVRFVSIQCPECEGPEGAWRDV